MLLDVVTDTFAKSFLPNTKINFFSSGHATVYRLRVRRVVMTQNMYYGLEPTTKFLQYFQTQNFLYYNILVLSLLTKNAK